MERIDGFSDGSEADVPARSSCACRTIWDARAARCCNPTTWKSAPARQPHCHLPARARPRAVEAPPTCSRRAGRRTAATARTPTASSSYHQYQVVLKPAPADILELYLGSLDRAGLRSRSRTTCASSRTTGRTRRWARGAGLGGLAERDGDHAVHLLPAGRRHRLQAAHRRDHLRPRAPGDVPAGRRERVRPAYAGPVLRRRLPPERGRAERSTTFEHSPTSTSSSGSLRRASRARRSA
jgi:hypothetical protein